MPTNGGVDNSALTHEVWTEAATRIAAAANSTTLIVHSKAPRSRSNVLILRQETSVMQAKMPAALAVSFRNPSDVR